MKAVASDAAPAAIGPYSQAVVANGMVFCSGQIPLLADGSDMLNADAAHQARQCLLNLKAVLEAAGSSMSRVVKTTIFLKNMVDFGAVNEVYAEAFGEHRPARATVEVARLPKDAKVEIDCVALLNE
ncbi:MAG: Rid family detoxifying hydrolase [Planctomycetes bacterium]|nr:Rid family detoxifying hydrolase [Planctomycetota bacterium]